MTQRAIQDFSAARAWKARHDVQFYEDDFALAASVGRFLAEGIRAAQPCVVVATPAHRNAFATYLRNIGIDVDTLTDGELVWLDARETLATFMDGDRPDVELFHVVATNLLEQLVSQRRYVTVRACGEMVDLLWRDGNHDAAVQLEHLWNALATRYQLALFCWYGRHGVRSGQDEERIARLHTHIV